MITSNKNCFKFRIISHIPYLFAPLHVFSDKKVGQTNYIGIASARERENTEPSLGKLGISHRKFEGRENLRVEKLKMQSNSSLQK